MNKIKIISIALFSEWKLFYQKNKTILELIEENETQKLYYSKIRSVYFFITGMGPDLSFEIISKHLRPNQTTFFNIGFCGVLQNKNFNLGDIIEPEKIIHEKKDKVFLNSSNLNFKKCKTLITTSLPVTHIRKIKNKKILYSDIVDMESYVIAEYCYKNQFNFNTIKIASDYSDKNTFKIIKKNMHTYREIIDEVIGILLNLWGNKKEIK